MNLEHSMLSPEKTALGILIEKIEKLDDAIAEHRIMWHIAGFLVGFALVWFAWPYLK